jgi:hypothetical protein
MKRRTFLQRAGTIIAGGGVTTGAARAAAEPEGAGRFDSQDARRVLVTCGESTLSRVVAEKLGRAFQIRVTATKPTETPFPFMQCDLSDDESTDALVDGIHSVVHIAASPPAATGTDLIDYRTRATYNLLRAAARRDVSNVVYLSSLAIMLGYDQQFMINEDFRPQPTPAPEILSHYLGEFTCREFARSGRLKVTVLRLGRSELREGDLPRSNELPRTRTEDVAAAVASALDDQNDAERGELRSWNVIHIHSKAHSTRFPLTKAERVLRYRPISVEDVP